MVDMQWEKWQWRNFGLKSGGTSKISDLVYLWNGGGPSSQSEEVGVRIPLPPKKLRLWKVVPSDIAQMNEVTLHSAPLVLRWVTILGYTVLPCSPSLRPTQPPTLSWTKDEYWLKFGDGLRPGRESGNGVFRLWIKRVYRAACMWSLVNMCHTCCSIHERLESE